MRKQHIPLLLGIVILSLFSDRCIVSNCVYSLRAERNVWPMAHTVCGTPACTNALGYDIFIGVGLRDPADAAGGCIQQYSDIASGKRDRYAGCRKGPLERPIQWRYQYFCTASEAGDHDRAGDFSGKLQPKSDPSDCCIQLGGDGPECPGKGHSPECPAFY